jgi:hypothetical protein
MTDLQTKTAVRNDVHVDLPFIVNEFQRVRIPPKTRVEEKEFGQMANVQKQKLMERLIDHVKDI